MHDPQGMRGLGSNTVRSSLNTLAERRLVKRLGALSTLLAKKVLQANDVWVEQVYIFDGSVRQEMRTMFRVGDLAPVASAVAASLAEPNRLKASFDMSKAAQAAYAGLCKHVDELRKVPSALLSFSALSSSCSSSAAGPAGRRDVVHRAGQQGFAAVRLPAGGGRQAGQQEGRDDAQDHVRQLRHRRRQQLRAVLRRAQEDGQGLPRGGRRGQRIRRLGGPGRHCLSKRTLPQ
jgi:hypothetical protein